jgi:hypothetical protein
MVDEFGRLRYLARGEMEMEMEMFVVMCLR